MILLGVVVNIVAILIHMYISLWMFNNCSRNYTVNNICFLIVLLTIMAHTVALCQLLQGIIK